MGYWKIPWPVRDPLEQTKLLSLVHIDTNTDGCWEWLGCKKNGYGYFYSKTLPRLAHRAVWTTLKGEITIGLYICHKCNNPSCCNPAHLYPGTARDNSDDQMRRGLRGPITYSWAKTLSSNIAVVAWRTAMGWEVE